MTSAHVRRLEARVARTAARLIEHPAWGTGATTTAADLLAMKLPWYTIRDQAGDQAEDAPDEPATVFLFDEIGGSFGVSAKKFAEELEAIDAPEIRVRINSPGGSVFDAIAIHSALLHHPARILVYVDALAASAASVVAMAGDELVMMPGSQMMIHDASALEDGQAADHAKLATFLDRQSVNVAELYARRAGGEVAEWRDLMLAETWMFAREAVALGLADRVEEPPPVPDEDLAGLMTRAHDLGQFRYAGREHAPTPQRRALDTSAEPLGGRSVDHIAALLDDERR